MKKKCCSKKQPFLGYFIFSKYIKVLSKENQNNPGHPVNKFLRKRKQLYDLVAKCVRCTQVQSLGKVEKKRGTENKIYQPELKQ
jgi:hypothetical protein